LHRHRSIATKKNTNAAGFIKKYDADFRPKWERLFLHVVIEFTSIDRVTNPGMSIKSNETRTGFYIEQTMA